MDNLNQRQHLDNLSEKQQLLLVEVGLAVDNDTEELLVLVARAVERGSAFELFSANELEQLSDLFNLSYRAGKEMITNYDYDHVFMAELARIKPGSDYLTRLEPEAAGEFGGKVVELSQRMLSTDKAYDVENILSWVDRVMIAAGKASIPEDAVVFELTPKLDGFAALDDGKTLCTRGNGYRGTDVSRVFERGLQIAEGGERGLGAGEIVIDNAYFDTFLSNHFENTRNFQSSVLRESELDERVKKAIGEGAAVFFPFSRLPRRVVTAEALIENFDALINEVWSLVPYDIDGVVIEAPALKEVMGHTAHHHRNTIAFKRNDPPVDVEVHTIVFQTGKTGVITPVAEYDPTMIGGAMLTRASLHNIGWAKKKGVGVGAICCVLRSGKVIPTLVKVKETAALTLPTHCASCGAPVVLDEDNLYCTNKLNCSAQVEATLKFFFETIGNCDGFGDKTLEQLSNNGIDSLVKIYSLNKDSLTSCGFGEKTAQNLLDELQRSKAIQVEDWRFLAAFSIEGVGVGACESLLKAVSIDEIHQLTEKEVLKINGFGEVRAASLIKALKEIKDVFDFLRPQFNLMLTPIGEQGDSSNPISGKTLVFTGSMQKGSRKEMEKEAKALGAKTTGKVTSKTDYVVIGDKPGGTKVNDAKAAGTAVITEEAYLELLGK